MRTHIAVIVSTLLGVPLLFGATEVSSAHGALSKPVAQASADLGPRADVTIQGGTMTV